MPNFMASPMTREALVRAVNEIMRQAGHARDPVTMSMRPERVDDLISKYYHPASGLTRGYVGQVSPPDFLRVTTWPSSIPHIIDEARAMGPLNRKILARLADPKWGIPVPHPMLHIRPDDPNAEDLQVLGHDSRHRNWLAYEAGVDQMPIALLRGGPYGSASSAADLQPAAQRRLLADPLYGGTMTAMGDGTAHNLIPIRPENRDAMIALGTQNRTKNHITYSLPLLMAALASQRRRNGDA